MDQMLLIALEKTQAITSKTADRIVIQKGVVIMLKRVSFEKYQVLKVIHKVTIITANDMEAVIFIQKQKGEKHNV